MKPWIYNIIIIVILYSIWSLGLEFLSKQYTNCECMSMQTYIFAGIIATIMLILHINNGCENYKKINDIAKMPMIIFICLTIIAIAIVWANKAWYKAVNHVNSGFVSAMSSSYIIIVTIISAYLFRTKITKEQYIGIGLMMGGCYLLAK